MMERGEMETGYLFTSKELAVLLASAGGSGITGFSLQNIEMDRRQVLYQLHTLFRKGILLPKKVGGGLEILPALRPAIYACLQARCILYIEEQLSTTETPFPSAIRPRKAGQLCAPVMNCRMDGYCNGALLRV